MTARSNSKILQLNQFRKILIDNNKSVSEIEYTKNNFNHRGELIEEDLPTITTDFCEIGLCNDEIYLVFIIESKTFNLDFFSEIKNKANVFIYGLKNFNKTLFPIENFDYNKFIEIIKQDKYLQIQFDYKNIALSDLYSEYVKIVEILDKNNAMVVNQLKDDM